MKLLRLTSDLQIRSQLSHLSEDISRMETPHEEIEALVSKISEKVKDGEHPQGYDLCLATASFLIEVAGDILADHEPGNRVSELMLLAARIEGLMKAPSSR